MLIRLSVLFVLLFQVNQSMAQRGESFELQCDHLDAITSSYLLNHVLYEKKTPELEKRTVDQFIKRLDPYKIYFTQSDVDKAKKDLAGIFQQIENKNCLGLKKTYDLYKKRQEERVNFINSQLTSDFKLDKKASIVLDPKQREYGKTEKESQEFHKKYLYFQVANYMATGEKLEDAVKKVAGNYKRLLENTKKYKEMEIYSDYLESFAHSLDPHSSYFAKDVLEDFEINMSLKLEGIGATLSSQDGFTIVEQLVPGGAAAKSGLIQPQDKIVAVGQVEGSTEKPLENVIEQDLRDVVRKIRGPKGTQVRLKIMRKKGDQVENFVVTLTRDRINLEDEAASISYLERANNGVKHKIGIVNLPSFYSDSKKDGRSAGKDVKKLLKEARAQKVDGIVLDLSYNGGGSLDDAVSVAGLFFKKGNVVKQGSKLTMKDGTQATALADKDEEVDWSGPLVILTSRISASASEIVAGTLQDYGRAVIVGGDHTFGKGSIQQVQTLPVGLGALKVTVGMFFTAGGYSTQHRGVPGDVVLPSIFAADDEEELGEKSLDYSLPPKKISSFLSPEAYVKTGNGVWTTVNKDSIKTLAERSKVRIAKDPEFEKILKDIAKIEKNKKALVIEDQLKEKSDSETKKKENRNKSKAQKEEDYLKRADIQEATNVLVDLVDLENKVALKEPAPYVDPKAKTAASEPENKGKSTGKKGTGKSKLEKADDVVKKKDADSDPTHGAIKK